MNRRFGVSAMRCLNQIRSNVSRQSNAISMRSLRKPELLPQRRRLMMNTRQIIMDHQRMLSSTQTCFNDCTAQQLLLRRSIGSGLTTGKFEFVIQSW